MTHRYAKRLLLLPLIFILSTAYAQLLDREITINMIQAPLGDVLHNIEARASVRFAYSPDQLDLNEPVTIQVEHQPLANVLTELFTPREIQFRVHEPEGTITLRRKKDEPQPETKRAVIPVTGVVTDVARQPLAGVNVVVKGTSNGTATDASGSYTLNVEVGEILVFSFIGFKTVEHSVRAETTINITLEGDSQSLEEVTINAGYYEVTQREQTGNIARITSKEISQQPVNNTLAALIGRMPGVMISQGSGLPGAGFGIEIRGRNSVRTDGNDPLYLVDGVPFPSATIAQLGQSAIPASNPLNAISPQDIESIEILKDADATAIYGSRGANGVVLITTKKGKAGRTRVDVNFSSGLSTANLNRMQQLSTPQYLEMRKEAIQNDNRWHQITNPAMANTWPDIVVWDTTRYTNWREKLLGGTAASWNAQTSLSGGNANTQFLISGNFNRETTVFPGDFAFTRGSGHMNIIHTLNRFSVSASATYTVSKNTLPSVDFARAAWTLAPNAPAIYDENGLLNWATHNGNSTWENPMSVLGKPYNASTSNLNTNLTLVYDILPGLKLRTLLGYSTTAQDETQMVFKQYLNPNDINARASNTVGDNTITTWIAEPQIEYKRLIKNSTLSALMGMTFNEINQHSSRIQATDFASDALVSNIKAATTVQILNVNAEQYKYAALFARLHYNWNDKYLINLTARRDGSSRFGPDNRMANFGAIGAAWIISNANFMKNSQTLTFAKIRASYGITGNDQIGNYRYLDSYTPTFFPYGVSGLEPIRIANPEYGWESNQKFEFGLETGWWQDKLQLMVSYYQNRSSNQLVGLPLPAITGFENVQFNLPATIQNTGVEIVLNTANITRKNFQWTTSANLTLPASEVVSFPFLKDLSDYALRFIEGEPTTIGLRYEFLELNPATGNYVFRDINEDGVLDRPNDARTIVDYGPGFFGGLSNSLKYKSWQLDLMLQFVKQDGNAVQSFFPMPGTINNQPVAVLDRWQQVDDLARYRRFSGTGSTTNYMQWQSSDALVTDLSFARLKNISLQWQVPIRNNNIVSRATCFVQGQNLLTITNYDGVDPEVRGITSLPPLRTVSIGFNLSL